MKRYIILFFIVFLNYHAFSQFNAFGVPFIKNYSRNEYKAAEQNWAICQDNRGVIYVGNNDAGVLEYDGISWNKIPIANNSIVRSLAKDSSGIIYVGAVGEFGYLKPTKLGNLKYYSLSKELDSIDFKDAYKLYTNDDEAYFCTVRKIFKYKNRKLVNIYDNIDGGFFSFLIKNEMYWGNYEEGLMKIIGDSVVVVEGGNFYKEKDIFVAFQYSENELFIGTNAYGCFLYNTISGESISISEINKDFKKTDEIIKNAFLYNGIKLKSGLIALATIDKGLFIINKDGIIINKIDKSNGLMDNTVINVFESKLGNIWLGLNNGIAFIETNSPFTFLGHKDGLDGIITDVVRFNNVLYVGTSSGIFYLTFNKNEYPEFKKVPNMDYQIWSFKVVNVNKKNRLLVSTSMGVREIRDRKLLSLDGIKPYYSKLLYQSKFDKNIVYVGYTNGLSYIKNVNGKWLDGEKIEGLNNDIKSITEDNQKNIWLGTSLNGIAKITPDKKVFRYDTSKGLPSLYANNVYKIGSAIVAATNKGLYQYNYVEDKFEKFCGFDSLYVENNKAVLKIYEEDENNYWIIYTNNDRTNSIERVSIANNKVDIESVIYKRLYNESIQNISKDSTGVWLSTSKGIYFINNLFESDFNTSFFGLNRKVKISIDSIIFEGTNYSDTADYIISNIQPRQLVRTIEYKYNDVSFNFSAPYFPNDNLEYSYKLDGYDHDWSLWLDKTERSYTNLNRGKYIFKVKAKNIYGIESEIAEYKFILSPPWYHTVIAYLVYFIIAIAIVILIVKIYTRRLELEKIRLEEIVKERTAEVVRQKEDIAEKNKSITDSIEYAKRIQKAILPSRELANEILPEHFILFRPRDIVSGDFYWMTKKDNLIVIIAADCTGHGVPGAFMSMLGVSFLNEIVNKHNIIKANSILNSLRDDVKKTLSQTGKEGEAKDGMDIALCIVDTDNMKMQYAGAYNPLYLYRNNELIEIKADRMPIGIYIKEKESFTNHEIDIQKNDTFYIFSDGYSDQFGGPDGRKFKTKEFKKLLLSIHKKPLIEQKEILNKKIDNWKGDYDQLDDIIVLGIRL